MVTAFVTGISGQDGSYLADRLVAEGAQLHGLIREWDEDALTLKARYPEISLHLGDLSDSKRVVSIIGDVQPDEIYNLAGISSVAQSWELPVLTGTITGVAVAAILDAALSLSEVKGRAVRVLQASSSEIFGTPSISPQTEETPIAPTSPYGAAKAYAHHMVRLYRARGLAASSVILYNHESPRRPKHFVTRKITSTVARIAAGEANSLELGALHVQRDWGWAPDYVDAMVRTIRHETNEDVIVATGESHSVAEFVAAAFAAAGVEDWEHYVSVNPAFVRPTEIGSMLGDSTKARRMLGWAPSVSFDGLVGRMVAEDIRLISESGSRP